MHFLLAKHIFNFTSFKLGRRKDITFVRDFFESLTKRIDDIKESSAKGMLRPFEQGSSLVHGGRTQEDGERKVSRPQGLQDEQGGAVSSDGNTLWDRLTKEGFKEDSKGCRNLRRGFGKTPEEGPEETVSFVLDVCVFRVYDTFVCVVGL